MSRKPSAVIEEDEHGYYGWCPELKGCQSEGRTWEEAMANLDEAIALFLETLPEDALEAARGTCRDERSVEPIVEEKA